MSKIGKAIRKVINIFKSEKLVPVVQTVPNSDLLKDRIAIITGGSGGIGMAVAKKFLESGAKVILCGTNESKLEKSKKLFNETNRLKCLCLNVSDVSSIPEKISEAVSLFEEERIDILVNCAGVIAKNNFYDMTEEEYDRVMSINAKGTFFVCQAVSKIMIDRKIKGNILNLSSASALRPAWTPYHMSKWAVRGFTIGLAEMLLPYGIIVNAIGPGPVATEMLGKNEGDSIYHSSNPSNRYATPEEIAQLALYMVSDMGRLIVGDTVYITGGSGIFTYHK